MSKIINGKKENLLEEENVPVKYLHEKIVKSDKVIDDDYVKKLLFCIFALKNTPFV